MIGELERGFRCGQRYGQNLQLLEKLLCKPTVAVVPVTRVTGDCYGHTKQALRAKRRPIPENDVWIAAQCLELGAVLVTGDQHFDYVEGLRIWGR